MGHVVSLQICPPHLILHLKSGMCSMCHKIGWDTPGPLLQLTVWQDSSALRFELSFGHFGSSAEITRHGLHCVGSGYHREAEPAAGGDGGVWLLGGYTSDHPAIVMFWRVIASFTDVQRRQLLKFVTSCSRPPLLGFKVCHLIIIITTITCYSTDRERPHRCCHQPKLLWLMPDIHCNSQWAGRCPQSCPFP